MPFLHKSYFCLDCEWIGEQSESCEQCASRAIQLLDTWINRTVKTEVEPYASALQHPEG